MHLRSILTRHAFLLVLPLAAGACTRDKLSQARNSVEARVRGVVSEQKPCHYGEPGGCPPERVCAYVSPTRAECHLRYAGATPFLRFPFDPSRAVTCLAGPQGTAPGERGHEYVDTLYAIDLASAPEEKTGGEVYASLEGTALVYRGCPDTGKETDTCGAGFGNHVRILTPDGYMLLYAHLGQTYLEDGQTVHVGEPVGREGRSGGTSGRHLHFSLHYAHVDSWIEALSHYRGQMGSLPPSIAFETQFCDPAVHPDCLRKRRRVEELPCGPKHEKDALRADWRD